MSLTMIVSMKLPKKILILNLVKIFHPPTKSGAV
jgi:hypothetical protein